VPYSILVVDDDSIFCDELEESLEEYKITSVCEPNNALEILEQPNDIDLMLLDVRLPKMKGTDLLKIIKDRYPGIFIIIMTGYAGKDVILESMRGKADDFIEKPLNVDTLKKMIQQLLASKRNCGVFKRDIDYVQYYIEKNCDKKVELEDIAALLGYSPKYMSRLFKQKTGINFNKYKTKIKMEQAKHYLENTDKQIKNIAFKIGYENSESFVRTFKKQNGLTPTEYRKQFTAEN
jgi:two-component system, response regulator YesN